MTKTILGISAQTLRHIELLLDSPWEVEVGGESAPRGSGQLTRVRIPNPVSFILQKLLIHLQRHERSKQAKDILYIHDTLLTFGHEAERLRSLWEHHQSLLSPEQRKRIEAVRHKLSEGTQDIHRRALEVARGAGRTDIDSAEQLRQLLEFGLSQVMD